MMEGARGEDHQKDHGRSKGGRHTVRALLACGMVAVLLTGCSDNRPVDYELDTQTESNEASGSLKQFAEAGSWNDDWIVTNADGEEMNLSVRAAVTVPDTDGMSVIEVEEAVIDTEFKAQFLTELFGNGNIYYHDPEFYTREEVEAEIAEYDRLIEEAQEGIDRLTENGINGDYQQGSYDMWTEWIERYETEQQQYRDLLAGAQDEYTLAQDYSICDNYLGYIGESLTAVSFHMMEDGSQAASSISAYNAGEGYSGPGSLSGYNKVERLQPVMGAVSEPGVNECVYSMDEAKELADTFLSHIGCEGMVCTDRQNVMWSGMNLDEDSMVTGEAQASYGYEFSYSSGVEGLALSESMLSYDVFGNSTTFPDRFYDSDSSIRLTVQNEGIVQVDMFYPITVNRISRAVELLPLASVQKIMEDEVAENTEAYDFEGSTSFNRMELIYFRVKDDEKLGSYSYVPAWRLCDEQHSGAYSHAVLVNAIDGTVIYIMDEL